MERAADTTGVKATDTELGRLGQVVRGNSVGLSLFLLVGLMLVGATLLVGRWVDDTDPGNGKAPVPAGIVALEFAGEKNPANEIIQGWRPGADAIAPAEKARDSLERDLVFILLYVVTLGYWCTYSSWLSHRPKVRRLARRLALAAVVAGLLDCVENIFLRRMVDAVEVSDSDARWATAASITKWVLVLMAGLCATGAVLSALNRWFARVIVGPASRPTFVGDIHAVPLPAPSIPDGDAYEQKKWERRGQTPDGSAWSAGRTEPAVGIALSGGGIRAASFALGALQGLQAAPFDTDAPAGPSVYARADFLSTVSGGGYTGTATQIINHQIGKGDPPPFGNETKEAEYVRDHCRFLWGPPLKGRRAQSTRDFISSALLALLGIAFNVLLVLGLLFVLARPLGWFIRSTLFVGLPPRPGVPRRHMTGGLWWGAVGSTIALLVILVPYFWRQRTTVSRARQSVPIIATIVVGVGVGLYIVRFGFPAKWPVFLVPLAFAALGLLLQRGGFQKGGPLAVTISWLLVGAAATLFGRWVDAAFRIASNGDVTSAPVFIIAAIFLFLILFVVVAAVMRVLLEPKRETVKPSRLVGGGALAAAIIAGVLTAVIVALCHDAYHVRIGSDRGAWLVVAVVMLITYLFLDQKRWSPHLVYKRRLATAFALSRDDTGKVDELPYRIGTSLSAWAEKVPGAPKLLVCGAVYDRVNVRRDDAGNKSDDIPAWPFVFSSDYVGNADLGWMRTVDFEAALGRANRPDGTLLAAMAISGAAVSPAIGAVKLGAWNALVAALNARLGVWLPNPRYVSQLRDETFNAPTWVRLRRFTYLLKDIVGAYSPDDRFVYVTDGGQFDNLAVYELLSRRCAEIFCVDASGDNAPGKQLNTNTFDDLRELARQRLGVLFSLPGRAPDGDTPRRVGGADVKVTRGGLTTRLCSADTTDLPESWKGNKPPMAVSENLVVTLEIHYPDGERGKLHYMKALLTNDAPGEVIRQATAATGHRFPSDTTVDQWLDKDQFEAYVELGRFAAERAVAERAQHS